ncbi:ATPase [Lactiplantibacillus plantarum]|uniref:ATPase n=1 Tax=Lactiplantibacillus plantarum TaxID=1590 RepID=UPI001BA8E671|nr:ATPase [Lactiplantibacillus plantarum]MBS0935695.1 ATPase [Lactiplantibacillus plantarum]MBS0943948.1 ATPase [Lactiplantibacillus plantarum]
MLTKRKIKQLQAAGYDLALLAHTQPQGNVDTTLDSHLRFGGSCVACLHVFKFPKDQLPYFWLRKFMKYDYTVTAISLGTEDQRKIRKALQGSVAETSSQARDANLKLIPRMEANEASQKQTALLQDLLHAEKMKRLTIRVFVYANTESQLRKRLTTIQDDIPDDFGVRVFYGEQEAEFKSLFVPPMKQQLLDNQRQGTPVAASVIGHGFPFNHIELDDPHGVYLGCSKTQGKIMLDPFYVGQTRVTSFFMEAGRPGSGKSVLAKMLNDIAFSRGAFTRTFDVANEYAKQCKLQGGLVISLDGSENRINPFEIFPTATTKDGQAIDEIGSFNHHIEKISSMACLQNLDLNNDDRVRIQNLTTDFYIMQKMWVANPSDNRERLYAIGLPHDQYPTLGEFVVYLRQVQDEYQIKHRPDVEVTSINRIVNTFENMMTKNGDIFNGITTIPDFSKLKTVVFDCAGLKNSGEATFNAQVYSALSLLSADIINNGKKYRTLFNNQKIALADVPYYWLNIDEFQNYAKPEFAEGIAWLTNLMEEMRKNFCGVNLVMPTIKDLLDDEKTVAPLERVQKYATAMKKMFGLFTYPTFFRLTSDDLPRLQQAFGKAITPEELETVTQLGEHECFMHIEGQGNYVFTVQASKAMLRRYDGGVG